MAALFAGPGQPKAFVPSLKSYARDAISGQPMEKDFLHRLQLEFDEAAMQFSAQGYEVFRLPFADHPVRSPANLLKYFDRAAGHQVVMLSKYPNHLAPVGMPMTRNGLGMQSMTLTTGFLAGNPHRTIIIFLGFSPLFTTCG
jgi:hypothetical protein